MMRILFADVAAEPRSTVEQLLRAAGVESSAVEGFAAARDMLHERGVDAIVCDARDNPEGVDLIRWISSHRPSTHIVVWVEELDVFREIFKHVPTVHFVSSLEPALVTALLLEIGPRKGFFGNAIEVELFDYIQMIALTGRDKRIEVCTPSGTGMIWFEHGDIVHVEYHDAVGEPAFYGLLAEAQGEFREAFIIPPPTRTVTRSSTHLLMEAVRQADEGTLVHNLVTNATHAVVDDLDDETSFADLNEITAADDEATAPFSFQSSEDAGTLLSDEAFAEVVEASLLERINGDHQAQLIGEAARSIAEGSASLDDTNSDISMLEEFWRIDGINGVAMISGTGKVLAEDMRNNSSLVTLAGFYMRGAARIARALGHNVFDGVVARSINGQQMVMVSMGAASAVLSVKPGIDPETIRDMVMGGGD